ncbi:MAG: carotenoid biosynthesis protein [Nitrospinae bacterium]|nr:carotenoid biosynthesis protein [Nitrospinota bacterium]
MEPNFIELLWGTVVLRPYVFAFLAAFLSAGITQMGLKRTLAFMACAYLIAFLSEYSSTRNGFPYGLYHYIEATRDRELWISNVPFMDSLSYVFLSYFSINTAIFFVAPLKRSGWEVRPVLTHEIRRSKKVLFLSPLLFMLLDVVIDPVALQGSRWFLGQIYYYPDGGIHFGVPLSNYAGWYIVGFAITLAYRLMFSAFQGTKEPGGKDFPYRDMLCPVVYFSVFIFNLTVTLCIGEFLMWACGMAIAGTIFYLFMRRVMSAAGF